MGACTLNRIFYYGRHTVQTRSAPRNRSTKHEKGQSESPALGLVLTSSSSPGVSILKIAEMSGRGLACPKRMTSSVAVRRMLVEESGHTS